MARTKNYDRYREILQALQKYGTYKETAKQLRCSEETIRAALNWAQSQKIDPVSEADKELYQKTGLKQSLYDTIQVYEYQISKQSEEILDFQSQLTKHRVLISLTIRKLSELTDLINNDKTDNATLIKHETKKIIGDLFKSYKQEGIMK